MRESTTSRLQTFVEEPTVDMGDATGASPAWTQEVALEKIRECEAEINSRSVQIADYVARIAEERELIEKARRRIYDLRSAHNAAAFIHKKLPTEVLMEVFCQIQTRPRRDIHVTHVCSHWRSIAFRTPRFWVNLVGMAGFLAPPRPYTWGAIKRTAPRCFGLSMRGCDIHHISAFYYYFQQSHLTRLTSLTVILSQDYLRYESELAELILPNLVHLILEYKSSPERITHLTRADQAYYLRRPPPEAHQFPHLRQLTTIAAFLNRLLPVSSLTFLDIVGHVPSPELFLRIVKTCQALEILQLSWPSCTAAFPVTVEPFTLPRLKKWVTDIEIERIAWLHFLLSRVLYTDSTALIVRSKARSLADVLVGNPPNPMSIPTADELYLSFKPNVAGKRGELLVWSSNTGSNRLGVLLQEAVWGRFRRYCGPTLLLPELVRLVAPALLHCVTCLTCEWPDVAVTRDDWALLLNAFPHLTELWVEVTSCRNIFRVLRKQPVCPKLEQLTVYCGNNKGAQEEVIATVEARAANGMRLRYLGYRSWSSLSKPFLRRLEAIVDDHRIEEYLPDDEPGAEPQASSQ